MRALVLLILLMVSASSSPARNESATPIDRPASVGHTPVTGRDEQQRAALGARLREIQPHRTFTILMPTEIAGYDAEVTTGPESSAPPGIVSMRLVSKQEDDQWIVVSQALPGSYGGLAMELPETADIGGGKAQLGCARDRQPQKPASVNTGDPEMLPCFDGADSGVREYVQLLWERGGAAYIFTGHNLPAAEVLRVARSMEPVGEAVP